MPKLGHSTEVASEMVSEQVTEHLIQKKKSAEEHTGIALTTMFMALLAAFGALMAGISAQDALIDRTAEIIDVSARESDRLAIDILKAKHEILISMGEKPDAGEVAQIQKYERDATKFAEESYNEEKQVQSVVLPHLVFAVAVTLLSVGIALNGIAVLADKQFPWLVGMVFGLIGAIGIGLGVLLMLMH